MSRRRRLDELRLELESWEEVPMCARAFHRVRRTLIEDVEEAAGRFLPWGGHESLVELEERSARLRPVKESLRDLFQRRDHIAAQYEALLARLESAPHPDSPLVDPSELSRWRVDLGRTGEGVRSAMDLEIEQRQLDEMAKEIETASELLKRSPGPAPPTTPRVEPTQTPLIPAFEAGISASSRADDPPALRPATSHRTHMRRLDDLGQRLWDWAAVAPAWSDTIAELSSRKENAITRLERSATGPEDGGDKEIHQVIAASENLLGEIVNEAALERQTRRRELEGRLRTLSQLVAHPDLERQAAALFARSVEGGRAHRSWLEELEGLESVLRDRLHNDHKKVDGAFEAGVSDLRRNLEALRSRSLPQSVAESLEELEAELRGLAATKGVEARFDALDGLRAQRRQLDHFREKAEAELSAFMQCREDLLRRITALETLADGLDSFDLLPGLGDDERTAEPTDIAQSLEGSRHTLDELERQVTSEEARYVDKCTAERRQQGERDRALASLLDVAVSLQLIDADLVNPGPGAKSVTDPAREPAAVDPASIHPAAAGAALEAARQRRRRHERALGQVEREVAQRIAPALGELESLDDRRLRPGERQELGELVVEAGELTPSGASIADLTTSEATEQGLSHLETQLGWLRRQGDLVDRVEGDRRRAVARHRQLVVRLERLERQRLSAACPRVLVERVHVLVHGLEETELDEAPSASQLAAAEQLLGRLEAHAHRLLAEELEDARLRLAGDPSPAAHAALAELQAAPTGQLPPPALRRRLFQLVLEEAS